MTADSAAVGTAPEPPAPDAVESPQRDAEPSVVKLPRQLAAPVKQPGDGSAADA